MKSVKFCGHQGDLCIYEVEEFPAGEKIKDKQCVEATLAYGELTGHAHQVDDLTAVDVFKNEKYPGVIFLHALKDATLRHGRERNFTGAEPDQWYHSEVTLKEGKKYITGIVEETDWIAKTIRRVVD